jgi:hypothetical protein
MLIGGTMMSKLATRKIKKSKVHSKNIDYQEEHLEDTYETEEDDIKIHFSKYQELNPEQIKIADWLDKLKFRKQVLGGINEYDVWKKIVELNAMYEEALKTERLRCRIMIDYYKNTSMLGEDDKEREEII